MKSYEEMANAVLLRVREEKASQKRRRRKLVAAVVCACFAGLAVFAGSKADQLTGDGEARKPRVSLFCVTASAAEQRQQMLKGEKLPYNAVIRVRDIRGLNALEQLKLKIEDRQYVESMAVQDTDDPPGNLVWSETSRCSDKTMVTTMFAGSFYMTVDDFKQIQDVTVTTTQIGWTAQHLADYYDESLRDGVGITWSLSEVGFDMIEKNPEIALSEIKDTITVTVEFKDGTKDIVVIDITVDDDGQIYGTFQGTDVIG